MNQTTSEVFEKLFAICGARESVRAVPTCPVGNLSFIPPETLRQDTQVKVWAELGKLGDEKLGNPSAAQNLAASFNDFSPQDFVLACCEVILRMYKSDGNKEFQETLKSAALAMLQATQGKNMDIDHSRALREILTLMIHWLQLSTDSKDQTNSHVLHQIRGSLTARVFSNRPALVGEAFVTCGQSSERVGDAGLAARCYLGAFKDLGQYVHANLPKHLRWELIAIHYWFEQACIGLARLSPENNEVREKLLQVQAVRNNNPVEVSSVPMFGPISNIYLDRIPYLALLVDQLYSCNTSPGEMFHLCQQYDYCHEADRYLFAIERHVAVLPILQGLVNLSYESDIEEVFHALDYAKQQRQLQEQSKACRINEEQP